MSNDINDNKDDEGFLEVRELQREHQWLGSIQGSHTHTQKRLVKVSNPKVALEIVLVNTPCLLIPFIIFSFIQETLVSSGYPGGVKDLRENKGCSIFPHGEEVGSK